MLYQITDQKITCYRVVLQEEEKSRATIEKYIRDVERLQRFLSGQQLSKARLIEYKEFLCEKYEVSSVNSMLAAVNHYLGYIGKSEWKLKQRKVQKLFFQNEEKELTRTEYFRLVQTANKQGNQRLSLILQTICTTGIRVSELSFITMDAVKNGRAIIQNKGKRRVILLPRQLCQILSVYMKSQNRMEGEVFVTAGGKPVDRSNIWREMKSLCNAAGVEEEKVFPHNLRHLFARTYYTKEKDLSRLADILGHSNVNTTRIYTMENGMMHARQMERLGLLVHTT